MEPNTPETAKSVSMYPSDALRCVAQSMNGKDREMIVTLPFISSWKEVLHATELALGEVDDTFMVIPKPTEAQQQRRRDKALQNVKDWEAIELARGSSSTQSFPGRPIRTSYDATSLPPLEPLSEEARKRLKENAMALDENFREPYPITLTANVTEGTLAIVKARVRLTGVDCKPDDPAEEFESIDMLWDTGAHQTIITEELLSESFRSSLQDPIHNPYRAKTSIRVQLEAFIAFSNSVIKISGIVLIVPKNQVPNQRVGIIFGQSDCIECISYRSIPRHILKAKGAEIGDDVWGDIVIDEYINEEGDLVSV